MDDWKILDVAKVYRWLAKPENYNKNIGMEEILLGLGIESAHLHNAGNDASYGLDVLRKLVEAAALGWKVGLIVQ